MPLSQTALSPDAEVDLAALRRARQAHDLRGAGPAEGHRPPGGALGERAQGEPLERRLAARELVGGDRDVAGARAHRLELLEHHPLEQRRLLGQLGARLGDVPLGGRAEIAEHRQHLDADPVAGEARVLVRLVVG